MGSFDDVCIWQSSEEESCPVTGCQSRPHDLPLALNNGRVVGGTNDHALNAKNKRNRPSIPPSLLHIPNILPHIQHRHKAELNMRNPIIPLLKRHPISLVNSRLSTDHFLLISSYPFFLFSNFIVRRVR